MQTIDTLSINSSLLSPDTPNTITPKPSINDTNINNNDPNAFNIEKVINSIYDIKNENQFYQLRDSVVATKNSEYIYRFAQGVLDIFFEEQHFDNVVPHNNVTISQKNIIYDETLNLLLEQSNKHHALSQFLLGKIYYTRKIYYKSFRFFELSLKNHLLDAAFYLGLLYEHGLGVDRDIRRAEYLYHCAVESTLGHIAMLQLAHLYLNHKVNGVLRIKEAIFWLEQAATLDSDLVDLEKINNLKNNNANTAINPLPLYESSTANRDDFETINEVVAPPRVQSLPFIKDRISSRTSHSLNTTPLLKPHLEKERRRSLATTKINQRYSHHHSHSYGSGQTLRTHSSAHLNSASSRKEVSDFNAPLILDQAQEAVTESPSNSKTEPPLAPSESYTLEALNTAFEDPANVSQESIQSTHSSNIIMSPSTIEDVTKFLLSDEEEENFLLQEYSDKNYFEKMKQKIAQCQSIQFNLQVQAEACFILYELYKNGYSNLLEKNLKLSKYYLNIASLNGSTKAMYHRGLYFSNSFEKTKEWITKAAEQNHLYSQILLTYWNLGGLNDQDIDEASALFWLQCASRLDNLPSEEEKMIQAKIWYVLGTFYEEGISDLLKPDDQESRLLYRLASCRNLAEAIIKLERYDNEDEESYDNNDYYAYLNQKKKHKKDHRKKDTMDKRLSRRPSKFFEKKHSKGVGSDDFSINTHRLSNGNTSDVGSLSSDTALKTPTNSIRRSSMSLMTANTGDRRNSISTNVSDYRRGSITTLTSSEYHRRSSISTNGNEYRRGSISTMTSNGNNMMGGRVGSVNGNYTDTDGSSYDNYSTVRTIDTLKTTDLDLTNNYTEVMEKRNPLSKKNSILRKGSFLNITSLFDKHDHSSNRSDAESISTNTIKGPSTEPVTNKYYIKINYIASTILAYLNIPQALLLPYPSQMATPTLQNSTSVALTPASSVHTPYLRSKSVHSSNPGPGLGLTNVSSSSSLSNLKRMGSISNSSVTNYPQNRLHSKVRGSSTASSIQSKSTTAHPHLNRSPDKSTRRSSHPIGKIIYTNEEENDSEDENDSTSSAITSDEEEDYQDHSDDTKKLSNVQKGGRMAHPPPKFIISSSSTDDKLESGLDRSGRPTSNEYGHLNKVIYNSPTMMAKEPIYQNKKYSNSDSKLSTIESSDKQTLELVHPIQKSKTVLGHKKKSSLNINNVTPLKPTSTHTATTLSDVDSVSSYRNSMYSQYPRSSYSSATSSNPLEEIRSKKNEETHLSGPYYSSDHDRTPTVNPYKTTLKSKSENEKIKLMPSTTPSYSPQPHRTYPAPLSSYTPTNTTNTYNIFEKKVHNYSFNNTATILDTPFMNSSPSLSEQISEQFNQLMEKEDSEISDPGEVIDLRDPPTEASETLATENENEDNETSTADYSYDMESSNDYSYEEYSVFDKRTTSLPFTSIMASSYDPTNVNATAHPNPNVTTVPSSGEAIPSKGKLKGKNKKRSLLKMRSIINSFSTEKERNNSLKKREELLNNTSFTFNPNSKDSNKKVYLKRYSNKSDSHSSTHSNPNVNLYRSTTLESNPSATNPLSYPTYSNPNAATATDLSMVNVNDPMMDDTYSELSKLHNKSFMKKSRELLKNKISKSKLLLHHKGSTNFNKLKHRSSKDNGSKSFMGHREVYTLEDPAYEGGEPNYIEENNFTYSSGKHSTSSKNSSRIYRHAQSLYDPQQEQLKSSHNLSELDTFKRTYSLIHKNYTGMVPTTPSSATTSTTTGMDKGSGSTPQDNHVLLENDYFKAYSSARPEDLYGEKQ